MTPFQRGRGYELGTEDGKLVTSYAWIEDCVARGRVVDPNAKALYAPLRSPDGRRFLRSRVRGWILWTGEIGYRGIDRGGGATHEEEVTSATTHAVCYRAGTPTYLKAATSGGSVVVVNHAWAEECVRRWTLLAPTSDPRFTKLGVEIDLEEEIDRERRLRSEAERELDEEERRAQSLRELLDAEEREREDLQHQLDDNESQRMALRDMLDGEADNREGVHEQFLRQRGDVEELQRLLRQSEASRAEQESRIVQGEEERRSLLRQLEQTRGLQTNLQTQFTHSRQDLLTQLEQRLEQIEETRSSSPRSDACTPRRGSCWRMNARCNSPRTRRLEWRRRRRRRRAIN